MPYRMADDARPFGVLAVAILASAAAALVLGPLAASAGALPGDDLVSDPAASVDGVAGAAVETVDDVAGAAVETVDGAADDAAGTVTSAADTAAETAGKVTTTVPDLGDAPQEPAVVVTPAPPVTGGDPPRTDDDPAPPDAGTGGKGTAGPPRETGSPAPATPAKTDDDGTEEAGGATLLRASGPPAGGLALVGLRSMLVPSTAAELDVPPPLVSAPEPAIEAPLIAPQEQFASISLPSASAPTGGSWLTGAPGAAVGTDVPAPLAVTAGGLVLLLGAAHALHAAGYLRPSFVKAPN